MTTSICIEIWIIFILPQSCQRTYAENYPAGAANTTFSVDSEDNVVITYGASKGPDNFWRYFATLSSNQSLRSGKGSKNNWFNSQGNIFVPFFITSNELLKF